MSPATGPRSHLNLVANDERRHASRCTAPMKQTPPRSDFSLWESADQAMALPGLEGVPRDVSDLFALLDREDDAIAALVAGLEGLGDGLATLRRSQTAKAELGRLPAEQLRAGIEQRRPALGAGST